MSSSARRVGQFVAHLVARVPAEDEARALALLPSGAARRLYAGMPVADRRHGLDVADALLAAGQADRDLLAAALLHDAAKGHRMRVWHRVAGVLLETLAPRLLARLASADERSWRHPLHLHLHHARLSAEAARAAGCGERTAAFIAGRVPAVDAELLAALARADDLS